MVIRNLSRKYVVVRECAPFDGAVRQYICRELLPEPGGAGIKEEGKPDQSFRAARQEVVRVSGEEIRFLMEQVKNVSFTDFVDFFNDGDSLYVMMKSGGGDSLSEKLAGERCSLSERLELGKNILERLLILNPAPFFISAAMDRELIRALPSDEVEFDYDLSGLEHFQETDFMAASKRMGEVYAFLFEEELSLRAIPELETLVYRFRQGEIGDVMEAYKQFLPVYQSWRGREPGDLKPKNFWFTLWERLKGIGRLLKKLVAPALLLLALAYLAASISWFLAEPGAKKEFSSIGTVEIREPGETGKGLGENGKTGEEPEGTGEAGKGPEGTGKAGKAPGETGEAGKGPEETGKAGKQPGEPGRNRQEGQL